jgi:hypothetical protein
MSVAGDHGHATVATRLVAAGGWDTGTRMKKAYLLCICGASDEEDMTKPGCHLLEIEYHPCGECQTKYLIRLSDDVVWTDDLEQVVIQVGAELRRLACPMRGK